MRVQLDTPNPAIPQDQLDKMDTNNTLALQKAINKTGTNQVLLVQSTTATNLSGATFSTPMNMQGVVTSSGGFFRITFKSTIGTAAGQYMTLKLFIDGTAAINLKDSVVVGSGADLNSVAFLEWEGKLGEGRHNIAVQASMSAGTGVLSNAGNYTTLKAVEIVL